MIVNKIPVSSYIIVSCYNGKAQPFWIVFYSSLDGLLKVATFCSKLGSHLLKLTFDSFGST